MCLPQFVINFRKGGRVWGNFGCNWLGFFPFSFGPQHLTPATAEYSPLQTSVSNFIVCLNIYKMKTKRLPCMLARRGTCLLFSAQLKNVYVAWLKDLRFMS